MMSKKLYVAVADKLGGLEPLKVRKEVAEFMADFFEEDNVRFDRERFLIAAGVLVTGQTNYVTVYVVQGDYGSGWEDLVSSTDKAIAELDLATHRDGEPLAAHRIIKRREIG